MKSSPLLFAFSILALVHVSAQVTPSSGPVVGAKAIPFSEKSTTGQQVSVPEGYKGKLVMLDFWATWCGPCRAELPNLVKVFEEFHPKGFEVVGISLDNESSLPKLAQFTQDNHMPWPQIADGKGWEAALGQKYGVRAIPASWLIDGTTGQVVAMQRELRGAALRATVERCLKNLGNPVSSAPNSAAESVPRAGPTPVPGPPDPALAVADQLAKAGKLTGANEFIGKITSPCHEKVELLAAATQPLKGREIAERARKAHVRIGWYYHCSRCNNWHLSVAGGYAIARDTVVTAFHVLEPPVNMKPGEGNPVVIRGESEVIPVTAVIEADKEVDAIILRVGTRDLAPLPLTPVVQIGDAAYCFSDPHQTLGYFRNGIVNRIYSVNAAAKSDPRFERINVSTDWSPGSSGSAVVDECGNVIGHVARIQSISRNASMPSAAATPSRSHAAESNPTFMNLHEAIPAKAILALLNGSAASR